MRTLPSATRRDERPRNRHRFQRPRARRRGSLRQGRVAKGPVTSRLRTQRHPPWVMAQPRSRSSSSKARTRSCRPQIRRPQPQPSHVRLAADNRLQPSKRPRQTAWVPPAAMQANPPACRWLSALSPARSLALPAYARGPLTPSAWTAPAGCPSSCRWARGLPWRVCHQTHSSLRQCCMAM